MKRGIKLQIISLSIVFGSLRSSRVALPRQREGATVEMERRDGKVGESDYRRSSSLRISPSPTWLETSPSPLKRLGPTRNDRESQEWTQ